MSNAAIPTCATLGTVASISTTGAEILAVAEAVVVRFLPEEGRRAVGRPSGTTAPVWVLVMGTVERAVCAVAIGASDSGLGGRMYISPKTGEQIACFEPSARLE